MRKIQILLAVAFVCAATSFGAVGSRDIEQWETDNKGKIAAIESTAQVLGGALAPTTGGISLVIVKIFSMIAAAFFGINRTIAANKRKRIIEEVDANPETPSVAAQVSTAAAKAIVNAMPGVS